MNTGSGTSGIDTLATNEPGHVLDWVMQPISYARHRFPPDIIRHAVWLYLRFASSYRDVEDLLAERGLMVSNELIRRWVLKFGPIIARNLRAIQPKPHSRGHLDEMVVSIAGFVPTVIVMTAAAEIARKTVSAANHIAFEQLRPLAEFNLLQKRNGRRACQPSDQQCSDFSRQPRLERVLAGSGMRPGGEPQTLPIFTQPTHLPSGPLIRVRRGSRSPGTREPLLRLEIWQPQLAVPFHFLHYHFTPSDRESALEYLPSNARSNAAAASGLSITIKSLSCRFSPDAEKFAAQVRSNLPSI